MNTRDLTLIALFAALTAAMGIIPGIPVPIIAVPVTLQTLGVMLAGNLLGAKRGFWSLFVFVALVAIGIPLLAGFRGGVGVLIGPSGGYVLSWPLAAFIIGGLVHMFGKKKTWKFFLANVIGGIFFVYLCGICYGVLVTQTAFWPFVVSNLAFIPGDLLKGILSAILAMRLHRVINKGNEGERSTKKQVA